MTQCQANKNDDNSGNCLENSKHDEIIKKKWINH